MAERLERVRADSDVRRRLTAQRLRRIAADAAPRWSDELGSRDHGDVLYDDRGLPR